MTTDAYDITFADGYTTPGRRKNNWVASNTPTTAHGSNFRFEVGSVWVFGSNIWVCTDATTGAAVWTSIDGGGSGSGFTNPMTTAYDLIVGGSGGTATRFAVGADHTHLASSNSVIVWKEEAPLHIDLSVSGAHDIDYGLAPTHDLTLTGNATFTLSGAITGQATDLRILLRQDGTGSRTVTWPGSVEWAGGVAPTLQTAANALDTIGLLTVDDGTTWLGYHADGGGGSSGTPATTVESETTFGISAAVGTDTEYARQDHTHGTPADPVTADAVKALGRWEPVQFDDGSSPWPFVYFNDEIVVAFVETP